MKKLFLIAILLLSQTAGAATGKPGVPLPSQVEKLLNSSSVHGPTVRLGTQVTQKKVNVLKAVYDFSKLGGASGTTVNLRDAAGGEAVLPTAAIVKQVMIDEVTNVTVATGGQIAFGVNTTTDLLGATAGATFSGTTAGTPTGTAAAAVKVTSSNKAVTATFSGNSTTAGKLNLFIEYYLSD